MPKPNPLTQGLEHHPPSAARTSALRATGKTVPPSRSGRVLIGGHFAPEVQMALKVIAAEERTTIQALLTEAINIVFAKRRKPEIAKMYTTEHV